MNILYAQLTEINIYFNESVVINLTNYEIPTLVKMLLSFGKNFSVPSIGPNIPIPQLISEVETIIKKLNDETITNDLHQQIIKIMDKYNNNNKLKLTTK